MKSLHQQPWSADLPRAHGSRPAAFAIAPLAGESDDLDEDDFEWDDDEGELFPGKDLDDLAEEEDDLDEDEDDDEDL